MKQFLKTIVILCVAWFGIHIGLIIFDGLNDNLNKADLGIVLGNKVDNNGQPSNRLKSRLDKAVELYHKGFFRYIIVSGGIGKEGFDEAEVMRDYLINNRIPSKVIIIDSRGKNTYLTAINSKLIMESFGFKSALIITQYYHVTRTRLAFSKVGIEKVFSAHADFFELRDIYSLLREFFGYYKYILLVQDAKNAPSYRALC
ncbi:MAG: YdcF family protein [Firmicutes bacterium]|nr:YdcF family protein [Bacillota bacterium]